MSERQKRRILEDRRDDFLQELFDAAAQGKSEALWKAYQAELEVGTAPEMPEELDAKCRELIRASQKKPKRIQFREIIGRGLEYAAIAVLVLLVLSSPLVMTVDAIKIPVMNFFVDKGGRYSSVLFGVDKQTIEETTILDKLLDVRLPEGYEVELIEYEINGFTNLQCKKLEDVLQVSVIPSDGEIDVDSEDAKVLSTQIYDWPAVFVQKKGFRVMWFNDDLDYVFDIRATNLTESEFWKYVYRVAELNYGKEK